MKRAIVHDSIWRLDPGVLPARPDWREDWLQSDFPLRTRVNNPQRHCGEVPCAS